MSKIKGLFVIIQFIITILILNASIYISKNNGHYARILWAKLQILLMTYKVKQKGTPNTEADILLINHQSLVDIVTLEALYPANLCWVTKQELAKIPLFGHIVKAPKMIAIDRKDKRSMIKMIKIAKERISEGRVIAMFPEGTRGEGNNLLDFHLGGKILAEKLNLKVQPVVLVNTRHIFDSKNISAHSGDVSLIYLDMIDPKKDENWFIKMKEDMQKGLDDELANYTSNR